jgi:3-oxoacid CoA-transferase B subunit
MGGAMDWVTSGTKIIVMLEHLSKYGEHKVVDKCTFPLTGYRVVDKLITDMAVFEFRNKEMYLTEIAKQYTLDDVKKATGCDFKIEGDLKTF